MGASVRPDTVDPKKGQRRVADPFADLADFVPGVEPAADDPFADMAQGPSLTPSTHAEGAFAATERGPLASVLSGIVKAIPAGEKAAAFIASLRNKRPYRENLDYAQGFTGQAAENDPAKMWASTALASAALPLGAVKGPMTAMKAAKMGGLAGGVYGAGEANSPDELISKTLWGAGTGAVAGAAFGKMLPSGGSVGADLAGRPGPRVPRRGVVMSANPLPELGDEARRSVMRTTDERALEKVLQDIDRSGTSVARIRAAAKDIPETKPVTLLEMIGENAQGRARAARALPSKAKQTIPERLSMRQEGSAERVIGDALETSGIGQRINFAESIDDMVARQEADAIRDYGPLRDIPVDHPELSRFFQNEEVQAAYNRARRIAKNEATAEKGEVALPPLEKLLDMDGNLKRSLTLGQLDRIKRAMDETIYHGRKGKALDEKGGLLPTEVRSVEKVKASFVQLLDDVVPEYQNARQTFAGHQNVRNAFESGSDLFGTHPDLAKKMLDEMSESEKEAFRKGAMSALVDKIDGMGSNFDVAKRVHEKPLDKRRMRLLFPDEDAYDQFRMRIGHEAHMARSTKNVLGNSMTADKMMELADMLDAPIEPMLQMMSGNPMGALNWLSRNRLVERVRAGNSALAGELGERLTAGTSGRDDLLKTLDALDAALAKQGKRTTRQTRYARGTGAATSTGITGPRDEER